MMKKVKVAKGKQTKSAEALTNLQQSKVISINMDEFITKQHAEYEKAQDTRATWISNQVKWFKKRYGVRPKKTYPWAGASNLHLPLQDKNIRKLKPDYVDVLWNTVPVCTMQPIGAEDVELAERMEWHFDWLIRTRMKIFPEICLSADKMLAKGFCIAKVRYTKETEPVVKVILRKEVEEAQAKYGVDLFNLDNFDLFMEMLVDLYGFDSTDDNDKTKMRNISTAFYSGAEAVEFSIDEITKDAPEVIILDPERITVPADTISILDLEQARWIDHTYDITPAELLKGKLEGKWKDDVVDEILRLHGIEDDNIQDVDYKKSGNEEDEGDIHRIKLEQKKREGLSNATKDDSITIHEVSLWYDSDGDGVEERHVLNYCEDYMLGELRFIKYPYWMKKWPFVKIPFEIVDERHYSPRGVIESLNPIADAMNVQHNTKINRQTLSTAPMIWYVPGKVNPNNIRFIPGQPLPVTAPGNQNIGEFRLSDTTISFEREEQMLKAWAEEYIASSDFGIASSINPMGTSKSRTATEIQGIKQSSAGVRKLDITIWKMAWAEIFDRIFSLWIEFGPESVWTAVDNSGKPQELTKEEIKNHYNVVPAGEITTSDPLLEAQKALARYQLLQGNPLVKQEELVRDVLFKDNPRIAKRLLKTDEELQKERLEAQQMQIQAQKEQNMKEIELAKIKANGGNGSRKQIAPVPAGATQ